MNSDCILVTTDFSEPSWKACQYALGLARKTGARLHVLHVIHEMEFYSPMFGGYMPSREQYAAAAEAGLQYALSDEDADDTQVTKEYRFGHAVNAILTCAQDIGAQLIVVGTHGRGGVSHMVYGSVAEEVVRHAACPVLTVHAEDHVPAETS